MREHHVLSVNEEISRGAVQLVRKYTGRGPTKARTDINDHAIAIVLGDSLTKAERNLASMGEGEKVLRTRHVRQQAMRPDLITLVEKQSGRKVAALLSANHIDPDLAVEFCVLDPPAGDEAALGMGSNDSR